MPSKLLSAVLVVCSTLFSAFIGQYLTGDPRGVILTGTAGFILGLAILTIIRVWLRQDAYRVIGGTVGTITASLLGYLVTSGLHYQIESPEIAVAMYGLIMSVFSLVGMQLGSVKAMELARKTGKISGNAQGVIGILDTSVIIDGRIADVCETGFLDGDLIIPQFVLQELQMIADSSEGTKRIRGRRGLDILNKMRKQAQVNIIITDMDYPTAKEVDQKLINMAKETGYAILTNDFNLNKVAEVHSIQVLNMNQLANALKPVVLPGEIMKVQIIKEGKEPGQGIAYLDDGTMVVIDHGRKLLGKNVDTVVTSVLQTPAGRMIFASVKN